MRILKQLMAKAFGPPPPPRPRYKFEIADGVYVETPMTDFGFDLPMPLIGRFAPKQDAPERTEQPTP